VTIAALDEELIILVDPADREMGVASKRTAHMLGLRHRAFSIMLNDDRGRALLQRRAADKYHSPGLWANSCCGHPRPGESIHEAAVRRAREELGVSVALREIGTFTYRAAVGDIMIEHEIDHVFVGTVIGELRPDPREVAELRWTLLEDVRRDLRRNPECYAPWLDGVIRTVGRLTRSEAPASGRPATL
jgi:isopentenyl-diphosphate delta-isomerase